MMGISPDENTIQQKTTQTEMNDQRKRTECNDRPARTEAEDQPMSKGDVNEDSSQRAKKQEPGEFIYHFVVM